MYSIFLYVVTALMYSIFLYVVTALMYSIFLYVVTALMYSIFPYFVTALMYSIFGVIISKSRGAEDELNTLVAATTTGLLYKSSGKAVVTSSQMLTFIQSKHI